METDHEIFFLWLFSSLLLIQEDSQVVVSFSRVKECTSTPCFTTQRTKPAQEKVWLGKLTPRHDLNSLDWAVNLQTKTEPKALMSNHKVCFDNKYIGDKT